MKKLFYVLVAAAMVFCVSCSDKGGANSGDADSQQTSSKSDASPAYVKSMEFIDTYKAKLENCKSADEFGMVCIEYGNALKEKYPDLTKDLSADELTKFSESVEEMSVLIQKLSKKFSGE